MERLSTTVQLALGVLFILLALSSIKFVLQSTKAPVEFIEKDTQIREYMREVKDLEDIFSTISISNDYQDTDAKTLLKILRYADHHGLDVRKKNVNVTKQERIALIKRLEENTDNSIILKMRPIRNNLGAIIGVDYDSTI